MSEVDDKGSVIFEERPWGTFTILDEGERYKVKRIEVFPGKRLSYQKQAQCAEHWMVVEGEGKVTLDGKEVSVPGGETIDVAAGVAHRIENPAAQKLIFIEIQGALSRRRRHRALARRLRSHPAGGTAPHI